MVFRGERLMMDNFRTVLKDYPIDIQDIVRSAILDMVDISKYIDPCKDNPFRLDQIRLGLKEGLNPKYFTYNRGDIIYGIRKLTNQGVNLSPLTKYKDSDLTKIYLWFIIQWCKEGYNISNLDLTIVPEYLLGTFNEGLKSGVDMSVFNNGIQYPVRYLEDCIHIKSEGLDVQKFLMGDYSTQILDYLSDLVNDKRKYKSIYDVISYDDSMDRVMNYEKICAMSKDLVPYAERGSNGRPVISDEVLEELVLGLESGIDLIGKIDSYDLELVKETIVEEKLKGRKLTSGRLIRKVATKKAI